jgi:hypothetical protein
MLGLEASRDFSFGYREKAVTTRAKLELLRLSLVLQVLRKLI